MYKKFFGLKENPFNVNPDPRYLFLTPHTQEALACLTYGIETRKGFILLTGEVGTGKTTLINKLLEWLHKERVFTAFVFNPRLSVSQFFDFMLADFGIQCESHQKGQMLVKLNQWLLDRYRAGERAVLIVDEAHLIRNAGTLEELRLLLNCQMNDQFLINLLLLGQLELRDKIAKVPALQQRLAVRQYLKPLNALETGEMILHRMRVAGYPGEHSPFAPDAIFEMHKYTRGTPRLISQIADNALMMAFARKQAGIDGYLIHEIISEFSEVEAAA